ncbi:MAG: pyridoxine 5'-phosphate synthase [Gemmatimonadaceae bacterium]
MTAAGDSGSSRHQRLYVNIDHVATLREARRTDEPDPVAAAAACERAGADGITAHLREDRRHIQDADIEALRVSITTVLNLEIACTPGMLRIATSIAPYQVTFVPERREEITTEGGLALGGDDRRLAEGIAQLRTAGIRASLFIDPHPGSVHRARDLGASAIELHTGGYANARDRNGPLGAITAAAELGVRLGLAVHAGHGLTVRNVAAVAATPGIEELNIGHSIVSRAIFVGLEESVREMRAAMNAARATLTANAARPTLIPPQPMERE